MFGWLSRASARASRANRSAKAGSAADLGRQDLEGDEAVEARLPGLVDRAHAALAEQFQDLKLREVPGEFFGRRCDGTGAASVPCSWPGSEPLLMASFNRHSGHSPSGRLAAVRPGSADSGGFPAWEVSPRLRFSSSRS